MGPALVHDALSFQVTRHGKDGIEGTVSEGQEGQPPRSGVTVGRGGCHHFFLPESYIREENEGFHGYGHRNEAR